MKFVIKGRLPSLNDMILASRGSVYGANQQKKRVQRDIIVQLPNVKVNEYPVEIHVNFYEPDNRRDVDNVIAGCKFLLDALVAKGILVNDSRKYVSQIQAFVFTDRDDPRIEVAVR